MSYYEDTWVPAYKKVINDIQENQGDLLKKPILKIHANEIINTLINADRVAFSYSHSDSRDPFEFISQCCRYINYLKTKKKEITNNKDINEIFNKSIQFLLTQAAYCTENYPSKKIKKLWEELTLTESELSKLPQTNHFFKNEIIKVKLKKKRKAEDSPQIFCGDDYTILKNDQTLYSVGSNHQGQLGLSSQENTILATFTLNKLNLHKDDKILKIASRYTHNLLLTQKGKVLAWGNNQFGQLGFAIETGSFHDFPQEIDLTALEDDKVIDVEVGAMHSIFLTEQGRLFSFGWNTSGQLGLGYYTQWLGSNTQLFISDEPKEIAFNNLGLSSNDKIIKIIVGCNHNFFITQEGKLFAWGYNRYGQLGLGDTVDHHSPSEINLEPLQLSESDKIQDLIAGEHHTLMLTQGDRIFAWGLNKHGQLGLGHYDSYAAPTELDLTKLSLNNDKIMKIVAGHFHSFLLTEQGQVFAWGNNENGALGLNLPYLPYNRLASPKKLANLKLHEGEKIIDIVAGNNFSFFVTDHSRIFACGSNHSNQLGLGPSFSDQPYFSPQELSFATLKSIENKEKTIPTLNF